ncbi:ABC transporter substrate-binding protein [Comamonas testosteroni]|uniref:ABC transporter substrate-binding protein n=1 Tax=Comamonas testosteroni TaxID=285 RepID=UPI002DC05427|nr:ABC transporter substrate-binding protein [Comamonas testosteroni]MEB5967389.1 ABC transporter substrate-binding protein [Comamonas testosteroni]
MQQKLNVALIGAAAILAGSPVMAQKAEKPLTVVLAQELDSLDPCDTQQAQNANIVRANVFESLTRVNPLDGKVAPLLAESWSQPNSKTWIFKLKKGVVFHDGSAFTAKVAAANIMRTQAGADFPGLSCLNSGQLPSPVAAKALDDLTLEVTTKVVDPILPLRLSYVDIGDLNSQKVAKVLNPIGTGPYKFVSRKQGESIKLTRADTYWGAKPQIKDVTYIVRKEPSVRASMVETGEADIALSIQAQDATKDGRTVTFKDNRVFVMRPMTFKEPFKDPRVRQALSYAINREALVPAILGVTGAPFYQMQGPQLNGYIADYDSRAMKYDPAKAKQLIAAAKADGHAVDTPFDIVTRPDILPDGGELVQAIAQNLRDVGLKGNIKSIENSAWRELLRAPFPAEQRPTLQMISHDNTSGDSSFSFPKYVTCKGNLSAICNPEIDRLIAEADVSGGDKRAQLYRQAAEILYKEGGIIGIAEQIRLIMLGKNVEYKPNSLSGLEIRIADVRRK